MQSNAVNAKKIILGWLHTFFLEIFEKRNGIFLCSKNIEHLEQKKMPKNAENFICKECNFVCSKNSNWQKHLSTAKHNFRTNRTEKMPKNAKIFKCECGKDYTARNSLWYHKAHCTYIESTNSRAHNVDNVDPPPQVISIMESLINDNRDFKKLLIEQNSQILELAKNTQIINNHTTNHNNQKFNLNFFLNDTCKDAMSITDFLRNMNVHIDEIEYIGNHGYVNGMTKMIMDRLKDMDITKRPIHCTDIKRETMYIKDDAGWSKDTDDLTKLRKILSRISMNNYRTVPDWRTAHPDCEVMESRTYDFCYKMMRAILGDVEEEQIKLDNKIIKTMAKELFIQK